MFTIALVGRPNVGKSTLFNRLVGRRLALVDDMPGLTRDRREAQATLAGHTVTLFDTAGLEEAGEISLEGRMRAQTDAAIMDADLCLFIVDARAGVTPIDEQFAGQLRKSGRPVILVANKCEGRANPAGLADTYGLGLGDPIAVSAEHGRGMSDLAQALEPFLEAGQAEAGDEDDDNRPLKLVITGRPNAGKSTLVNQLIGAERMLTGAEAGITRDAISVDWQWNGRAVRLFDTAGMRRRARVNQRPEQLARGDAMRAVKYAEIVVLLMDATQNLEKQDLHIADTIETEGRGLVLALNKIDLVEDREALMTSAREVADRRLPQLRGIPIVGLSASSGAGVSKLMPAVFKVYDRWNSRISTGALNRWFSFVIAQHAPPAPAGRRIKLRYMTQANARPPTFVVFCSRPEVLPTSYQRYIVNEMRKEFDLEGVPIRLHLRKGKNPYRP
ncbi:MAG: ribosome biogenesis GTPase Der [Alphaproteobacteria bacterium]